MGTSRSKLLTVLLLLCVALAAVLVYVELQPRDIRKLTINNTAVTVELAQTPQALTRGLSKRANLGDNAGMLLDFGAPHSAGIWMRHMNFPLDVIWLDENLQIITISESLTPDTYPSVFYPAQPARYVLEVNAGWVSANKITVGMIAKLAVDTASTLY